MAEEADMPEPDKEMQAQLLLLAASQHDLTKLRVLLRSESANVQDPETGSTPLHAAIAACGPEEEDAESHGTTNGHDPNSTKDEIENGKKTAKLLLQNGAIWNDLDANEETPGCIALRLGLKELYDVMVDAGVRAELLLNRLNEYEELGEGDEEVVEEEGDDAGNSGSNGPLPLDEAPTDVNSGDYLRSALTFQEDRLLDADSNGVMMAWETDIMKRTAELLLPVEGLRVLNVGHGMGIIDEQFQAKTPASHHIIEAHPAVVDRLRSKGWHERPNVVVHEGRWQDVLPKLLEENAAFDAIYFDTFAEDYSALRNFFSEYVIGLLDAQGGADGEGGRWGFFNGLGADRQVCYDVYSKLVEMDLFEAGFDTDWEDMAVPDLDQRGEWKGVRRKYWVADRYRLPTCKFIG
ncbi:MAG: Arginine N-methyltransferase 2 [Thelocarpon impressellum]|nr:MAG: Arginine N-methyltransferase 2 [Thelocarpon impressellum]